ncbi:MAG: cold shock and DUF1294 domain-containing protein [Pirellulales bacterium]
MRRQGHISEWNDERGFGFIRPQGSAGRVFVHISAFPRGGRRPVVAEEVRYELGRDERGRPCATTATFLVERPPARVRRRPSPQFLAAVVSASTFLAFVGLTVHKGLLHWAVLAAYVLASVATYRAYVADKYAAESRGWRTREGKLHFLGLVGGWPGALVAQHRLRHKTKKRSFQVVFWFTVAMNCAGLIVFRPALLGLQSVIDMRQIERLKDSLF